MPPRRAAARREMPVASVGAMRRPWHHAAGQAHQDARAEPGGRMKIVKLEDFHVDGGWDSYSFLKITTDKGLVGWAEFKESRRRGLAALIHGLGSTLIREDPRATGRIAAALYSHIRTTAGGLQSNAVGAILNACLDIKGKALGVPVHDLIDGAAREASPLYWSRCGVIRARCAAFFD